MSSTTNIQNLLVNVFRPTYTYDPIASLFQAKLDMSNVNTVYANVFSGLRADIGDANNNMYVGVGSGNPIDVSNACGNNTVLGVYAGSGMSNVSNSIYLGYTAGLASSNADQTIGIGVNVNGNGDCNIYIGSRTGGTGNNNLFIGHDISAGPTVSNTMYIGFQTPLITGKFAETAPYPRRVGVLETSPVYPIHLGDYTYVYNGLGINADPAAHSLNVNGDCRMEDGFGLLQFDQNRTSFNSIFSVESYTSNKILEATFGSPTNDASMNVYGYLNVTKGYSSHQGVINVPASTSVAVAPLKKGRILISAVDPAGPNNHYAFYTLYASTDSIVVLTNVDTQLGHIDVLHGLGNIYISNSSLSDISGSWSVTYFSLP